MADIERTAQADWNGELLKGSGKTSTGSGVLSNVPYSVPSRFESAKGTNPEELLAAAHASCFSMMLAKVLGDEKKTARSIKTQASLTLGQRGGGWKIVKIHLQTQVSGDGIDDAVLKKAAEVAKDQCPVSVLLKPGLESITLDAKVG
jgi:lipoyl-dependent peroxiredoxin